MNYTPEQQQDIERLQELGALVTDADTVKYEKEVAPEESMTPRLLSFWQARR